MHTVQKQYYKTGEAARILGLSPQTIRHRCETGEIPGAFRFNGISSAWLIPQSFITGLSKPKPKFPPNMTIRQKLLAIKKGEIIP